MATKQIFQLITKAYPLDTDNSLSILRLLTAPEGGPSIAMGQTADATQGDGGTPFTTSITDADLTALWYDVTLDPAMPPGSIIGVPIGTSKYGAFVVRSLIMTVAIGQVIPFTGVTATVDTTIRIAYVQMVDTIANDGVPAGVVPVLEEGGKRMTVFVGPGFTLNSLGVGVPYAAAVA
jgi:hypothetical protein